MTETTPPFEMPSQVPTQQVVDLVNRLFPGDLLGVTRGRSTDAPDGTPADPDPEDADLEPAYDMPCETVRFKGGGLVRITYDEDQPDIALEVTACHPGDFSGDLLFFEPEYGDRLNDEDLTALGDYLQQINQDDDEEE